MDVRFFETFLEVARTRHFGKAAEQLYLTQSAISSRIRQLEEYFHAPLFARHRNSIQLTVAGEQLLPYAESLVKTLRQAKSSLDQVNSGIHPLRLATTANAWFLVGKDLTQHWSQSDEYSLSVEFSDKHQLVRQLQEHQADVALVHHPLKSDDLHGQVIRSFDMHLFASSQEMPPRQYVKLHLFNKAMEDWEKGHLNKSTTICTTESIQVALDMLKAQGGCCLLPNVIDENNLNALQLSEVRIAQLPLYLYTRKGDNHPERTRFKKWCEQFLQEEASAS